MNFEELLQNKSKFCDKMSADPKFCLSVEYVTHVLIGVLLNKGKILVVGNGGSAADAQHFAAELVVKFSKLRQPYPVMALTTDTSILTACANDFSFQEVFSRQVEAWGRDGDALVAITTSGNSENVIKAMEVAYNKGMSIILLTGATGGEAVNRSHSASIRVPSLDTAEIQETHEMILHYICAVIDKFIIS